jgi:23S rRNA pseudouridine1911/1915/1917 synthase
MTDTDEPIRMAVLRVGSQDDGVRLDAFLARRFQRSRNAVRRRLGGSVLDARGRPLKWSRRLRKGEEVRVRTLALPEPDVSVVFRILHQDEAIVVVDKGASAPVHPSRSWKKHTV